MNKKLVDAVLVSKSKGDKWVVVAAPVIASVVKEKKEMEENLKEELAPFSDTVKDIRAKYADGLAELAAADLQLREKVLAEHEGTGAIEIEGVMTVTFPMRQGFEVEDVTKVPKEYLTVDTVAVGNAIKAGVAKIKGIKMEKKRGIQIKLVKPGE